MMEPYRAYELGRKSAEALSKALRDVLCCPGDEECHDTLAKLAPYLVGIEDCDMLEMALNLYFSWLSLRWAHSPCAENPSTKKPLVLAALCNTRQPVPEDVFREALGEGDNGDQAGEL